MFQVRLRQALLEDRPTFAVWDQERAAVDREYLSQSSTAALVEFGEIRDQTVTFLKAAPVDQWQRVGIHPSRGEKTVEEMVTWQIKSHDLSHLVQIKDILRIKMPW